MPEASLEHELMRCEEDNGEKRERGWPASRESTTRTNEQARISDARQSHYTEVLRFEPSSNARLRATRWRFGTQI